MIEACARGESQGTQWKPSGFLSPMPALGCDSAMSRIPPRAVRFAHPYLQCCRSTFGPKPCTIVLCAIEPKCRALIDQFRYV